MLTYALRKAVVPKSALLADDSEEVAILLMNGTLMVATRHIKGAEELTLWVEMAEKLGDALHLIS